MSSPQSGRARPGLVTAVSFGVAVLALFSAANSYQISSAYAKQFPDAYGAAAAESRFSGVTSEVPAKEILGYITDLDPAQGSFSSAFLAAQYALAPRQLAIVNAQNKPERAVGNFSKPLDFAAAGAAHGYELVRDLGNGVILFHRKTS